MLQTIQDCVLSIPGLITLFGIVLLLIMAKRYFGGSRCTVDRDLTGKTIVITGANAGIGRPTMEELAKRECTIIFGARREKQSQDVIKAIRTTNSKAKILFYKLDLSQLSSIRQFADRVSDSCDKIDILINNAGLIVETRTQTKDGFEKNIGVNHFGHAYLTHLLLPKLKKVPNFRIIFVSSKAHVEIKTQNDFDLEDIDLKNTPFHTYYAYSRSKSANILFASELQRRIEEAGLEGFAVSLHPGVVRTDIFQNLPRYAKLVLKWLLWPAWYIAFKSAWEGAQTTLHTVLETDERLVKGGYYDECAPRKPRSFSRNPKNAAKLWEITENRLGIKVACHLMTIILEQFFFEYIKKQRANIRVRSVDIGQISEYVETFSMIQEVLETKITSFAYI